MIKLDLKDPKNFALIEKLKLGTSLHVPHASKEGTIEEIYANSSGNNFFINAFWSVPAPIRCDVPGGAQVIQNIFISVYYNKEAKRVEKAVIIPDATFTPVVGSDMMGILDTKKGYMMTYSIGESISNNSPIEFIDLKNSIGREVTSLTFEKAGYYFTVCVDKIGNIVSPIYNSITDNFEETNSIGMPDFEEAFLISAEREADLTEKENKLRRAEVLMRIYGLLPRRQT